MERTTGSRASVTLPQKLRVVKIPTPAIKASGPTTFLPSLRPGLGFETSRLTLKGIFPLGMKFHDLVA